MGEKRQIFHSENSKNVCRYSTLKEWERNSEHSVEKGVKSNFTVEKLWQTLPQPNDQGQYQQSNFIDSMYPWYNVMRMVLCFCDFHLSNPYPILWKEIYLTNSSMKAFYYIPDQNSSKLSKLWKNLRNVTTKGATVFPRIAYNFYLSLKLAHQ